MKLQLFYKSYYAPGPGVQKDAPQAKGARRFFVLLARQFAAVVKLNLLVCAILAPALLLYQIAFYNMGVPLAFVCALVPALLLGLLAGPVMTAACNLLCKLLRGEAFFFWHDFRKSFQNSFRQTALFGAVYTCLMGLQCYILSMPEILQGNVASLAGLAFSMLLFHMVCPYYLLQAGHVDLAPGVLWRNSLYYAIGYAPKSVVAALGFLVSFVLSALLFPFLLLPALLFGFSVPALISCMWLWPVINETMKIEEQLHKRQAHTLDGA